MSHVVELVSFRLKKEVSEEHFLEASDKFSSGFLSLQKGYLSRQLIKKDDIWSDLIQWETMEDAMNAVKAIEQSTAAVPYCDCIDESTCTMQHMTVIKSYFDQSA